MTQNARGLDKYNIGRKADFIRLTILLHDLECFSEDLQEPAMDLKSHLRKFRNTRNVFVSLYNVRDTVNDVKFESNDDFIATTRALRKQLQFVGHVRNKGVGHLDPDVLKRASQWEPYIFYDKLNSREDVTTLLCYKSLLETSVNSYNNGKGHFPSEIDFMYPPDLINFYQYLSKIVNDSIRWIREAREFVAKEIPVHSKEMLMEHAIIAGSTNFDLKAESNTNINSLAVKETMSASLDKLREHGVNKDLIKTLFDEINAWTIE